MACMLALLSPPAPTHGVTKQKQPRGPSEARLPSLVHHSPGSGDWIPEEPTGPAFSPSTPSSLPLAPCAILTTREES